jgi:hypothetical protein
VDPEEAAKKAAAEEEAKRAAARAHGITVTVERFMEWKAAFDAEMAAVSCADELDCSSCAARACLPTHGCREQAPCT